MNWHELHRWYRVTRDATLTRTTPAIAHSETLDGLTQTCAFTLIDQEAFTGNTPVALELVDLDAGITRVLFDGTYDVSEVESQPQEIAITSTGPLALLRNVRKQSGSGAFAGDDGDKLLTGMTDGEVVSYILTYCGVPHDPSAIDDAGYVLGEHADLWWRVDEPGSTIVGEMDDVFGSKTFEVGAFVVRRFYNLAPSATGLYRTYTKGEDFDLWATHRSYGHRDQIQSAWSVRGVSTPCGPGNACTCVPWAKARASNPALGSRRFRVQTQSFDSDIIQSSSLAEAIVRRLMRWHNRRPDTVSITTLVDKNVHPTSVIGLVDPTPHIDAEVVRYYTVTTVDRSEWDQTIQAIGGAGGDEGTVTSGTEMICNQSEGSQDWSTPFTDPSDSFPPIDAGLGFGALPNLDDFAEITPPPPPDVISPFLLCTEAGGMTGTVNPLHIDGAGLAAWEFVENSVWRTDDSIGATVGVHLTGGVIDEIRLWGATIFALNLEGGFNSTRNIANDVALGTNPQLFVTGEVWFKEPAADPSNPFEMRWLLDRPTGVLDASAGFFPVPGYNYVRPAPESNPPNRYAVRTITENELAIATPHSVPPGVCTALTLQCNNGGFMGEETPLATGTWIPFSVAFDLTGQEQRIDVLAGSVGGYILDQACWGTTCQNQTNYPLSTSLHTLHWAVVFVDSGGSLADPKFKIRNIKTFYATCAPNPDYIPPARL